MKSPTGKLTTATQREEKSRIVKRQFFRIRRLNFYTNR